MEREEAMNLIRQYKGNWIDEVQEAIETIIPELRESEDEITRKRLINLIRELASATVPIMTGGYFIDGQDKRYIAYLEKQKEQKPVEWSEEDKAHIESLLKRLDGMCKKGATFTQTRFSVSEDMDWLKTLRPQPKQEWSEEDEEMLNSCISSIEESKENRYAYKETDGDTSYDREVDWLKSLRPSWKPSEEQMDALESAQLMYAHGFGRGDIAVVLESLYNDLKKLM